MASPFLLLLLLLIFLPLCISQPPPPRSFFLDCGATAASTIDGVRWSPDSSYISVGTPRSVPRPGLLPTLSTVRSFPYRRSDGHRRFCYSLPVYARSLYVLRTTYFYGGATPPVFDQVVDGTVWTVVNTTADHQNDLASYYEGVYDPPRKTLSLCVAANAEYTDSDPFISSIELFLLDSSVYNSTNFSTSALALVGRNSFGYKGAYLRYPDDQFNRYWQPFWDSTRAVRNSENISVSGLWNLPPAKIFENSLVAESGKPLELQWPVVSLPNATYYIALYFADSLSENSRLFDIYLNGILFYRNMSVSSSGVSVFATSWPLSGSTKLQLVSSDGSRLPPLINGGEIFGILTLAGVTRTRDVIALSNTLKEIKNSPSSWNGDPCLPRMYAWSGLSCSEAPLMRVTALNYTGMGFSGTLSGSVANLTALTGIFLGNNKFSGPIPDLSQLKSLERLHLQNNQFNGTLPASLGKLDKLRELFVENNNLSGEIPAVLLNKPGLKFRHDGNRFSNPPQK